MHRLIKEKLPRHLSIIMDGNGRWAEKRSLDRLAGHQQGAESVRQAVQNCRKLGIPYLTLFAFSSEN
jgi:undecaprenyl diphosphate synthase